MPVLWLSKEKCVNMLPYQAYGRLATVGPDNRPYITPVNYVYEEDAVFIHGGFSGRKIDNIRANSSVCFEISSRGNLYISEKACGFSMRYWSIIVEGKAEEVADPAVKKMAIGSFMEKYGRGFEFTPATDEDIEKVNVIRINIEKISGKMGIDPQDETT